MVEVVQAVIAPQLVTVFHNNLIRSPSALAVQHKLLETLKEITDRTASLIPLPPLAAVGVVLKAVAPNLSLTVKTEVPAAVPAVVVLLLDYL